jgi:hypothetical protein
MPTISEPVIEANEWTYNRVRAAFVQGILGPAAFRVSLHHLGLRGQDLDAEIALAMMERKRRPLP